MCALKAFCNFLFHVAYVFYEESQRKVQKKSTTVIEAEFIPLMLLFRYKVLILCLCVGYSIGVNSDVDDPGQNGVTLKRFRSKRFRRYDQTRYRRLSATKNIFLRSVNKHSNVKDHSTTKDSILDVVIVGAGWAGASAGITLQEKGITNFRILEGRSVTGGRSRSVLQSWEGEDIPIDLGSQWVHGVSGNPIMDIVRANGMPYSISEGQQIFFRESNGGPFPSNEIVSLESELYSGKNGFLSYQEGKQESTWNDQSLRITANQYIASNNLSSYKKKVLQMFFNTFIGQEYAASLDDLSLWWWDSDGEFNGQDAFLYQGYSNLFDAYTKSIQNKIQTSSKVTLIDTRSKISKVEYIDENGLESVLQARKVLVTVPLGVLKAGTIQFKPRLPSKKRRAITNLGMGLLNKVVLFFNEPDNFWPLNIEWFTDSSFEFYNPPMSLNGDKSFLVGFLYGDDAKSLEEEFGNDRELYESKMTARAMVALRNMFGAGIPDPEISIVTQWGSDPYSFGSYSFNKVGMGRKARKLLNKTIRKKRLYFAGEACHTDFFGTVHGKWFLRNDKCRRACFKRFFVFIRSISLRGENG